MASDLTPSEDLALEVIAARYRLGHTSWLFDKKHKKVLESLEKKGYIRLSPGVIDGSYNAVLTPDGMKATLSSTYTPPIYKFVKDEFVDAFIVKD